MNQTEQQQYPGTTPVDVGVEVGFRMECAPATLHESEVLEVERGNRMFRERVGAIFGVLRVEVIGDERRIGDCSFKVYVDPQSGA